MLPLLLPLLALPAADLWGGYNRSATATSAAVSPPDEYPLALARVRAGDRALLVIGPDVPALNEGPLYRTPSLLDFEPGVYDCWNENGVPTMQRRPTLVPPPVRLHALTLSPAVFPQCTGPNCR